MKENSKQNTVDLSSEEKDNKKYGDINERDRLEAAKQILIGLAFLYALSLACYLVMPEKGDNILEICKTAFPPLATLIIAFYFKDKNN